MKGLFLIAFLTMATFSHAQKHEIYLGYNAASFFDEHRLTRNSFDFYNIKFYGEVVRRLQKIPVIGYRFHFDNGYSTGIQYSYFGKRYVPIIQEGVLDTTLIGRAISTIKLGVQKSFSFSCFEVSPQLAYVYRYNGVRFTHLFSRLPEYPEAVGEDYAYHHHGLSTGVDLRHPIFRGLHGILNASYTRFWASKDKNFLMVSYSLGYSFGCKKKKVQKSEAVSE